MGRRDDHIEKYRTFKADAERPENSREIRAEAYFLAAFHLIDSCAAAHNVHIDKHQRVRQELEADDFIFGKETGRVWHLFQRLERDLRPRFVYGFKGSERDFKDLQDAFAELEAGCAKVVG